MMDRDTKVRLLMVDDERDFLQAVEPGLVRRGFDVILAEDGATALKLMASHEFDVAVLDVKMPGIDGVDLFRRMKESVPNMPVVLLTGHGSIQDAFETSREGVFEYLTKPCDVDRLAQVIRLAAESAEGSRALPSMAQGEIRLLLVDDDLEFVRALAPALERRGMEVQEAFDGAEALGLLKQEAFDVALVDVVMDGMDGLTLLNHITETDPFLEVVILTGNPRVGDVRQGLMDGAFDYLTKPQPVEALVDAISGAWRRGRRKRELARAEEQERIISQIPE